MTYMYRDLSFSNAKTFIIGVSRATPTRDEQNLTENQNHKKSEETAPPKIEPN